MLTAQTMLRSLLEILCNPPIPVGSETREYHWTSFRTENARLEQFGPRMLMLSDLTNTWNFDDSTGYYYGLVPHDSMKPVFLVAMENTALVEIVCNVCIIAGLMGAVFPDCERAVDSPEDMLLGGMKVWTAAQTA